MGNRRVHLKAGESRVVVFKPNLKRDLKMLDRDNKWVVEPGKFEVMISEFSDREGLEQKASFTSVK